MDWKQYICADPHILHGAVAFVGTRVPVSVVLDNLADGATPDVILSQYPGLRSEYISAALAYAADLARERVVPVRPSVGEVQAGREPTRGCRADPD